MVLRKLVISNLLTRKVRVALTVAAIALSVSLVVAVTSGYASFVGAAMSYLNRFVGSTDVILTRQANTPFPQALADEIAADPQVARIVPRLDNDGGLINSNGTLVSAGGAHIVGIQRPLDTNVENLTLIAGNWFNTDDGDEAVIDQIAAEKLSAKVGGGFAVSGPTGQLKLKIAAIVHKPGILANHQQTVYMPIKALQRFAMAGQAPHLTRAMIELKSKGSANAFADRWRGKLEAIDPLLRLRLMRENRSELDKNLQGLHVLSYMGGTVSMLAAAFIVFSALSMGVAERQRTLAMLRAIGMEKSRVGWLVVAEGIALAIVGVIIGVPLGWVWVKILTLIPAFKEILTAGVILSWGGVALGVFGSILTALAASLLPAWNAMRVSPLEAMSPLAAGAGARVPWKLTIVGVLLACIDVILIWGPIDSLIPSPQIARAVRFYGHFALGIPGIMIGFFLLAPLFVWLLERLGGPIVSVMFGLRGGLLRQQLSGGIWRAAGTCAALMVGLAILVVMNVQGNSALSGWKLPDKFPDVFIVAPPLSPLDEAAIAKLERTPGLKKGQVMPIAIASPEFSNPIFAMLGAAILPNATMFLGVDPDKATEMMELDFREGTPESAREMLKKGRHIIVTEEFRQLKGLHVGDKLSLKTTRHGDVEYTIAGVVWSPGIDVIVSVQDMGRQLDTRTAASVFGSLADAKEDFGVDRVFLIAANLDRYHWERDQIVGAIQERLGMQGIKVGDIRAIKASVQNGFRRLLLLVSTVALAAMAVASLGVTNTIMASIRSRRWTFGVLRSIGVTRGQLLRMVLAEALLLGLVGVALGLSAGALLSLDAKGFSRITIGYLPPTAIPWEIVWGGSGAIVLISLLASLWPAWAVARTEPLSLLQAGRASA